MSMPLVGAGPSGSIAAPPAFNPEDIADIQWYGDYRSNLRCLDSGGIPAVTGAAVQTAIDLFAANNAINATESNRPVYRETDGPGGVGCLRFAVDDFLQLGISLNNASQFTYFGTFRLTGAYMDALIGNSDSNSAIIITSTSAARMRAQSGTTRAFTLANPTGTDWHVCTAWRDASNNMNIAIDGVLATSGALNDTGSFNFLRLGSRGGSDPMDGDKCHDLMYGRHLNVSEMNQIGAFLQSDCNNAFTWTNMV